jgi:hypothetical protein
MTITIRSICTTILLNFNTHRLTSRWKELERNFIDLLVIWNFYFANIIFNDSIRHSTHFY